MTENSTPTQETDPADVAKSERVDVKMVDGALVPTTLDELWRVASMIYKAGMATADLMESPERIAIAIQMGAEIGLAPMAAVQNIAVINGRPSVWGDAALAVVKASGQLEIFKEYFTGTPVDLTDSNGELIEDSEGNPITGFEIDDNLTAICEVKRRGEALIVRTFSLKEAGVAGLYPGTDKYGKVSPAAVWNKYTKRMLQMRPRGFALRDGFPDRLRGLLLAEEIQGGFADVDLTRGPGEVFQVEEKTGEKVDYDKGAKKAPESASKARSGSTVPEDAKEEPPGESQDSQRSYAERMKVAASADEGRVLIQEYEAVYAQIQQLADVPQTVGKGAQGMAEVGFSTLSAQALLRDVKEVGLKDPELGDRLRELIDDIKAAEIHWNALLTKEYENLSKESGAQTEQTATPEGMCKRKTWDLLGEVCNEFGTPRKEVLEELFKGKDRKPTMKELPQVDAEIAIERVRKGIVKKAAAEEEEKEVIEPDNDETPGEWKIPGWIIAEGREPENDQYAATAGSFYDFLKNISIEKKIEFTQEQVDFICKERGSVKMLHNMMVNPSVGKNLIMQLLFPEANMTEDPGAGEPGDGGGGDGDPGTGDGKETKERDFLTD